MYTKDNSWNSFAIHMIEEGYAKDEDTLLEHMALIPAKSREIIEKRWGLIEKVYYSDFEQLNEQMGIDNARELYFEAMRDLFNAEYAAIGMKRYNMQTISHWNEVVAWGMLFAQDTTTATIDTANSVKEEETSVVKKDNSELLKRPLVKLNFLSKHLSTTLHKAGCHTLEEVFNLSNQQLFSIDGFGPQRAYELLDFLKLTRLSENEGKKTFLDIQKHFRSTRYFLSMQQQSLDFKKISDILNFPIEKFRRYLYSYSSKRLEKSGCTTIEDLLNCNAIKLMRGNTSDCIMAAEILRLLNNIGIQPTRDKEFYTSVAELYDWDFLFPTESN